MLLRILKLALSMMLWAALVALIYVFFPVVAVVMYVSSYFLFGVMTYYFVTGQLFPKEGTGEAEIAA